MVEAERVQKHSEVKKLMVQGRFNEALELLQGLRKNFPDHIGVVCDQAVCSYEMGQFFSAKNYLAEAERLFESCREKIDFLCCARSWICLGKLWEEFGCVGKAYKTFSTCIERWWKASQQAEVSMARQLKQMIRLANAQYLRLASNYALPTQDFFSIYQELKGGVQEIPDHLAFDVEHSLLIAEIYNYGWSAGEPRLKKILFSEAVEDLDKKQVFFDALEYWLNFSSSEEPLPEYLLSFLKNSFSSNTYESVLRGIADKNPQACEEAFLMVLNGQDAVATILRLGKVVMSQGVFPARHMELRRIVGKALETLPAEEQKIWSLYLDGAKRHSSLMAVAELTLTENGVSLGARFVSLEKRPVTKRLLEFLAQNTSTTDARLSEFLYGVPMNASGVKRLRTLITRTNQLLFTLTALRKCVHYSGTAVKLDSEVKIRQMFP